jgi:hypothetical protein
MISPIDEIFGREHMIIFHAKPSNTSSPFACRDIMRRIEIHFTFKNPC